MNRIRSVLGGGILVGSILLAAPAQASDAVLGAVIGGGAGALIGQSLGGRDGAIIGSAIGAAAGASAASSGGRYHSSRGRPVVVHQVHVPPAPVYYVPAPVYRVPPAVVYRPAPAYHLAPPARYRPAPVIVDHRGSRGQWKSAYRGSGRPGWHHHHQARPYR